MSSVAVDPQDLLEQTLGGGPYTHCRGGTKTYMSPEVMCIALISICLHAIVI